MDLQTVTQFMLQNFEQTQIKDNGTHFLARCPLCGDSKKNKYKKRFNLNWNNGIPGYHCWNCGKHGNFIEIYSIIKGISYEDAKKEIFKYDKELIKRKTKEYKKRPEKKVEREIIENNFNWIKKYCYEISNITSRNLGILEKRYLKELENFYIKRKIQKRYKIYICYEGKYKGRIIIPIFNEYNDIIYFQARRIPGSKIEPKYDNPISPKESCILNKHNFNKEMDIVITEGLVDAFMIGNQGTSCLGKEISEDLIRELLNFTNKDIIITLDNDSEGYKSLSRFMKNNKYSKKVKYFIYPKEFEKHKDINEIFVNENIDVYNIITENKFDYFKANLKLKI